MARQTKIQARKAYVLYSDNAFILIYAVSTAEEYRERRRMERKQFKLDRAQAIAAVAAEAEAIFAAEGRVITPALSGPSIPSAATWKPTSRPNPDADSPTEPEEEELEDVEHLQLTLAEAFFLAWNFDCLTIWDSSTVATFSLYLPQPKCNTFSSTNS